MQAHDTSDVNHTLCHDHVLLPPSLWVTAVNPVRLDVMICFSLHFQKTHRLINWLLRLKFFYVLKQRLIPGFGQQRRPEHVEMRAIIYYREKKLQKILISCRLRGSCYKFEKCKVKPVVRGRRQTRACKALVLALPDCSTASGHS